MSVVVNDNFEVRAPKPIDGYEGPWVSVAAAIAAIPSDYIYPGRTVKVIINGAAEEYWFKDGVNLVPKGADPNKNITAKQHISTSPGAIPSPVNVGGNTAFQDANFVAHLPADSYGAGRYPGYAFWTDGMDASTLYFRPTQEGANYGLWLLNIQGRHNRLAFVSDIPAVPYLGKYTTLAALQAVTGFGGAYAYFDPGNGTDASEYIWDETDSKWVPSTKSAASTFGQLAGVPGDNAALASAIAGLQPKEAGKGLSQENYTTQEKTKLAGINMSPQILYVAPVNTSPDIYFEKATQITSVTLKNASAFSYSINDGVSYLTPALPLAAPINLAAGTWVKFRITFMANKSTATAILKIA